MAYHSHIDHLAIDLAFWYMGLTNPRYPIASLGPLSQDVSVKFRALGIMFLLAHGSTDGFLHHLRRAGNARLIYLRRLHQVGNPPAVVGAAGKYRPLLSAIAAGDWALAREIVALSPTTLTRGEYGDDHFLARVVGRFVQDPAAAASEFDDYLDRWQECLDGHEDPRLNVLTAIIRSQQGDFDSAFDEVLERFDADVNAAKERRQLEEPVTLALREVDVDALAFLRIAELRGLHTAREYPFCPSLARVPMRVPFPAD